MSAVVGRPTFEEVWAGVAGEPDTAALAKLWRFLGRGDGPDQGHGDGHGHSSEDHGYSGGLNCAAGGGAASSLVEDLVGGRLEGLDPLACAALGRQRLGSYGARDCGFSLLHLCADRDQVVGSPPRESCREGGGAWGPGVLGCARSSTDVGLAPIGSGKSSC